MRIIAITITTIAPTALPTTVAMELEESPAGVDIGGEEVEGEEVVGEEDGVGPRMLVKRNDRSKQYKDGSRVNR